MGRLTHEKQNHDCEFLLSKYHQFFNESDSCTNTPILNIIIIIIVNKREKKIALTYNVHKVIRALAFRSCEKFDNSFLFKIVAGSQSYKL